MSSEINVEVIDNSREKTYVVNGATMTCSLGTSSSTLQVVAEKRCRIKEKKQANIGDHGGGSNIPSFGNCFRADPPPSCIMATSGKWIGGKEDVYVDGDKALLNTSVNMCSCGGVVSIVHDGQ